MLANDISFEAISGLQTLLEALSKKVCKIVFIGNSVTAQKKGYRQYLSDLITQESKFQHNYINAGIGGVGSLASAFFVNDFVLRHRPDICFVECTVADIEGATPTHFIPDSIHGIIKKLKSQNIIICFLHLFNSNKSSIKVNHIISMYDGILAQYGVPSINIYQAFSKLIDSGEYRNDDLLFDGVHTTDFGARLTAKYIFDAFLNVCEFNVKLNSYPTASNRAHSILEFTEITKPDKCLVNASKNFSRNKFKNIISYIELKQEEFICFKVK
jgi:lysophospholipase L1-like esterase